MPKLFEDYEFFETIESVKINITKGKVYITSTNQQESITKNYEPTKETVDKLLDIAYKNKTFQNNDKEKNQLKLKDTQLKLENTQLKLEELQKMIGSLNARLIDDKSVIPSI